MERNEKPKDQKKGDLKTSIALNILTDKPTEDKTNLRILTVEKAKLNTPEGKRFVGWAKTWNNLDDELVNLNAAAKNIFRNVETSNPEPEKKLVTRSALDAIKVAYNLLANNVFERQTGIIKAASEYNAEDCFKTNKSPNSTFHQELFIKFGGLSLFDILTVKNLDLSKYLEATVKATQAIREPCFYNEVLLENKGNPMLEADPDTAKKNVLNACEQLALLSILNQDLFSLVRMPKHSKNEQEIFEKTKENIDIISAIRKELLKTLFHSSSPNFTALSETLEKIIDKNDQDLTDMTLLKFGFENPITARSAYRAAAWLALKDNPQSSFYTKLAKAIKGFTKNSILGRDIRIFEDVCSIFHEEELKSALTVSFEDIQAINKRILNFSSKREYGINPSDVKCCNSNNISKITVGFLYKNDPTKLLITLTGEKINFQLGLDTKAQEIEWQFLEDPDDPKMQDAKNAAILATYSALNSMQKQAEIEHQEKLKVEQEVIKSSTNGNGHKKSTEETIIWTPREKIEEPKPKKLSAIEKLLQGEIPAPVKESVRRHIDIPTEIESIRPKNIADEQWEKLIEKIKRYNQNNGVGSLELLVKTEVKERIFRLKVDKKWRVLVTENDFNNGNGQGKSQHYKINRIIKRNDEYKEI